MRRAGESGGPAWALALAALALGGCIAVAGGRTGSGDSVGTITKGLLESPAHLPAEGPHYRSYKGWDRRYGLPGLTGLVERAAARVAEAFPGAVLLVGDMSARGGGFISDHVSHRTGRDADLAFYVTDAGGRASPGAPLILFDRFGAGSRARRAYRFDTATNWRLVEALLTDPETDVQWIFVSDGLKALLLDWALRHGADLTLVERAAEVLHQPEESKPHDDHFHVRIYCPEGGDASLCVDTGPIWPWVRTAARAGNRYSREELLRLALESIAD